jgi:hypothetical protein
MDHWYFKNIRYALMTENHNSFFVIWIGQKHVPMKNTLLASSTTDLTWVKSGYLEVLNPNNGQKTLVFSETTLRNNGYEHSPDLSLGIQQSKIIFKDAWNLTVTNNKELVDDLYQQGFLKLKFITHQGSHIMNFR